MATSTKSYRHQDYTVAWVCAVPLEMTAAMAMLDETHRDLPVKQHDNNSYILGRINSHNVVIACLPSGVYGLTSATTVAAQMRYSFESIRFFLMVGIGGGVPIGKNDIRLGDVVVSKPTMNLGGVIQYDYGKALNGGHFQRTGTLNKPPPVLLSAIAKVQATYMPNPGKLASIISEITTVRTAERNMFACPGEDQDILFDQGYDHPGSGEICSSCDTRKLVRRPARANHGPIVHYGLIASGNQVMKDSRARDKLAQEYDILCFEMEAAGLMDNFPCLVIRGICDYSDSHKNKQWQNYAAATAAGYAKELLSAVHKTHIIDTPPAELDLSFYVRDNPYRRVPMDVMPRQCTDKDLLENMSRYEHNKIHWKLSQKRLQNTTQWFLDHPSFKEWFIEKKISSLWCSGKIGSGKTMIATAVIDAAKSRFSGHRSPVVFFYCDYEYNDKMDVSFIISSFVKQICEFLHQQSGHYPENIASDLQKFFGSQRILPDFDDLRNVFSRLFHAVPDTIYIIDGIDALQDTHAICFLKLIQRLFCSSDASQMSRILILSRDQLPGYINIVTFIPGIRQISISTNAEQDIANYIETSIDEKMMYRKLTDDASLLNEIKQTLLIESSNMFLWVYLQIEILWDTCHTDAEIRYALTTLPRNLEETYKRCVCRIDFQQGWALKVLKWVSFAKKPLHIEELREAVAFQSTDTKWDANKKPQRDFIIGCCANLVVVDPIDNCVRFAHSSVKQYLEEDRKKAREERFVSGYPTEEIGDLECGEYCVSYLAFEDFSLQLIRPLTTEIATTIPSPYAIAQSVSSTKLLKALFRKSQNQSNSMSMPFRTIRTPAAPSRAQYRFLDYAIANWAFHTRQIHCESSVWDKFEQLAMCVNETWNFHPWVPGGRSKVSYLHGLFGWAVTERHKPLLSLVSNMTSSLSQFCDLPLVGEGLPAIHLAVKFGYEDMIESLIKFCDINGVDQDGYTPLHHAAIHAHTKIVRLLLLQKEIKFDVMSIAHQTPLWLAANSGFKDIVFLLIIKGASTEIKGSGRGHTPLWRAVKNGHRSTAKLLLANGAQVDCQDFSGHTALGLAIMKRNLPMITLLLDYGAVFKHKDLELFLDFTQWSIENNFEASTKLLIERNMSHKMKELVPLAVGRGRAAVVKMLLEASPSFVDQELMFWAAERSHSEVIKQLLAKGSSPNVKDEANKNATPLHCATTSPYNDTAIMKLLLRNGADVNAMDENGEMPLHWAVERASRGVSLGSYVLSPEPIQLLLYNGAKVNCESHDGRTPLHKASKHGCAPVMQLLFDNGASVDPTNRDMQTPLHEANIRGCLPAMTLLLQRGANINAKDHLGRTPLHNISENRGPIEAMKLLLESGADVNSKDSDGKTPLDLAKEKRFRQGTQLILKNGARQAS